MTAPLVWQVIWFSPHCLPAVNDGELFAERGEASALAVEVG